MHSARVHCTQQSVRSTRNALSGACVPSLSLRVRVMFCVLLLQANVHCAALEAALEAALGVNPDSGDPGPTLTRSDSEVTLPW